MTAFTPAPVHPTPIHVPPKETPTKILMKLFSLQKKIKLRAVKSKEKSPCRGSH